MAKKARHYADAIRGHEPVKQFSLIDRYVAPEVVSYETKNAANTKKRQPRALYFRRLI